MTTNSDETTLYNDLEGFLLSSRADLRLAATDAVLQTLQNSNNSSTAVVVSAMLRHGGILPALAKNVNYSDHRKVAVQALQALVLFTSEPQSGPQAVVDFLQVHGLSRLLEVVLSSLPNDTSITKEERRDWRRQINFSCALLANSTRDEQGAVEMVGKTLPDEAVAVIDDSSSSPEDRANTVQPTMELLLARFLQDSYIVTPPEVHNRDDDNGNSKSDDELALDPYQHFAAVLMNCTQVENGQRFLLRILHSSSSKKQQATSVLQKLLPQLRSPNWIRRRGIAGICRNCCLDRDSAFWLLNTVKITKHLLYPLAGPEELDVDEKQGLDPDLWLEGPDKVREPDTLTRLYLVESILLLCGSGRPSRQQLRLERAYVILKWADMVEEDERINEQIYECVNYLRGDEEGTAEGSSDKYVAEAYQKLTAVTSGSSSNTQSVDYDDVD